MSTAGGNRKRGSCKTRGKSFPAIAFVLLLGGSAAGLFCWQWAGQTVPAGDAVSFAADDRGLSAREVFPPSLIWPGQSDRSRRTSGYRSLLSETKSDLAAVSRAAGMRIVREDPFLESLASGIGEGSLVVAGRSRGIPTFSTQNSMRRTAGLSDRALLSEIRSGVGGSLSSFLNKVFGTAQEGEGSKAEDPAEKNPFAKPAESEPVETSAKPSEPRTDPAPAKESKPAPEPPAAVPPVESTPADTGRLVTTVRPDLMLHIDPDGILHTMPADRLNDRTYETAEMGIREFHTLNFSHPAEIPAALAVADFNADGLPDICFVDSRIGVLRFVYAAADGTYAEGMRVEVGTGPRSLAAGDYNGDGRTDVAISNVGVGALTYLLLGPSEDAHSYQSFWVDRFRDYIAAADTTGNGILDLLGLSFANVAEVLDSRKGRDMLPGRFDVTPVLDYRIATAGGRQIKLSAVMFGKGLSLNMENSQNGLANVLNLQAGADVYIVIGDLNHDNSISLALATLKSK